LAEPLSVFDGRDEGLDHFRLDEVAVELIQLREPEVDPEVTSMLDGMKRRRESGTPDLQDDTPDAA
jgi:hypothetical protein